MKSMFWMLPLVFCGFGCGPSLHYVVGTNGYTSSGLNLHLPQTSSISVVADVNAPNPLLEKEVATKIQTLLTDRGYRNAPISEGNFYLTFEYGVDSGESKTGALPMYQAGGIATGRTFDSYGGSSYSTIQTPGYITYVPYSYTAHKRWLTLSLYDRSPAESKAEPLWIGTITSNGTSSDLRDVINYMLVVGFDHFGENTKKQIITELSGADKRVKTLTSE